MVTDEQEDIMKLTDAFPLHECTKEV